MKKYIAHEIAGDPDLYNKVYTFGHSKLEWECEGYTRKGTTILFARIEPVENMKLKVYKKYVKPDTTLNLIER